MPSLISAYFEFERFCLPTFYLDEWKPLSFYFELIARKKNNMNLREIILHERKIWGAKLATNASHEKKRSLPDYIEIIRVWMRSV